jgi:hypothetical protein
MITHFFDAKRKIERAITHINCIEKWLWTLNKSSSEIARAHKQSAPDRNLHMVNTKWPKGYSWPVGPMIGDAIHNLRAALDAIAWSIVAAGGKDDPEQSYFPLASDEQLPTTKKFIMICSAIPEVGPIISRFVQGYRPSPSCDLWVLNRLDRVDKHRCVLHTETRSTGTIVAIRKEVENDPPPIELGSIYSVPQQLLSDKEELTPGSLAYEHNQTSGFPITRIYFGDVLKDEQVIPKLWRFTERVSALIDDLDDEIFRLEANQT